MDKKYILIAVPHDNPLSGEDIINFIVGLYFKEPFHDNNKNPFLISNDNTIKLIFIIINDCKDIYNAITFSKDFRLQHKNILNKNKLDLIIAVVRNDCFSEFFLTNWRFLKTRNKTPVISITNTKNVFSYSNDFEKIINYNRDNKIIYININPDENIMTNVFSQLVYSLIERPKITIYSSVPSEKLSFLNELFSSFFPHALIKITHPNKNNSLSPSKDIISLKNKFILFIIDEEIINLDNLNFFVDLYHSSPENFSLFCTLKSVENKVTRDLFPYELENKIQCLREEYYEHKDNDKNIQKYIKNLDLLKDKIPTIRNLLKESNFYGEGIHTHMEMIYQLEKKLYRDFFSISIISNIDNNKIKIKSKIKSKINTILEKNIDSHDNYNQYVINAGGDVFILEKGDVVGKKYATII